MEILLDLKMGIVEAPTASYSSPPKLSQWHSSVPYLFGGLAALLGLIGFALLVLACSYWRHSDNLENQGDNENPGENERGLEAGEVNDTVPPNFEALVIMAGQENPTFLATPMSRGENRRQNNDGNVEMGNMEDREAS